MGSLLRHTPYSFYIKMSWQAYVDSQLVGTGYCKKGIIIGHDGSLWAASAGFQLKGNEGQSLAKQFVDPSSAFSGGIMIAGEKYMCIKADSRSIYGKKGAGGVACQDHPSHPHRNL